MHWTVIVSESVMPYINTSNANVHDTANGMELHAAWWWPHTWFRRGTHLPELRRMSLPPRFRQKWLVWKHAPKWILPLYDPISHAYYLGHLPAIALLINQEWPIGWWQDGMAVIVVTRVTFAELLACLEYPSFYAMPCCIVCLVACLKWFLYPNGKSRKLCVWHSKAIFSALSCALNSSCCCLLGCLSPNYRITEALVAVADS